MAVDAHFLSHNMDNFLMSSTPHSNNLTPLPPQMFDFGAHVFSDNNTQQQRFVQGMGMVSYPCSSTSYTTATATTGNETSLLNSLALSQSFAALLDKHRREVDLYLYLQGEKLREALHQQKRQQMAVLLHTYESSTTALMRQKEQDLEKLRRKTATLEQFLKKTEEETEMWQRIAKEKEEMAMELNNMLLLVKQNMGNLVPQQHNKTNNDGDNDDNDAESVCDCGSLNKSIGHAGEGHNKSHEKQRSACKWCHCGGLCVVFLPCKHLCCCKDCEPILELCPVCHSLKQGSIEILLS